MARRARQITTLLLVIFAVAATVAGVVRIVRDASPDPAVEFAGETPRVIVFYLHGDARCDKCVTMQKYSEAAVREAFAAEIAGGTVAFREVNYHEPADAHYAEDFNISSPSLVVVRYENGQRVGHENLTDIWDLVDDEPAFRAYVIGHVSTALERP